MRHTPTPRLKAGRALGRIPGVGGCIDISDGLCADLEHLLAPAGLTADLDPAALPRPPRFAAACARLGLDPESLLLEGGEDYELLFTLRRRAPSAAALTRRLGVAVTVIGHVVSGRSRRAGGGRPGGWRHF
jgi:thiamine-monophosphate kinase